MSAEVTIICDKCSSVIVAARTAGEARREGLRDRLMVRRGKKDICVPCAKAASEPRLLHRDFDLIAVPWIESASDALTLIRAMRRKTHTVTQHEKSDRKWEKDCSPTQRPHGRVSYSLHVTNSGMYGGYLDISVMPRVKRERKKPKR